MRIIFLFTLLSARVLSLPHSFSKTGVRRLSPIRTGVLDRSGTNLYGQGGDFDERDNGTLLVWRSLKQTLPPIVTGAWNGSEGDDNPLGAMYNLVFVRVVTLLCSAWYVRAGLLGEGGGSFSLDFGIGGPIEVPPVGVALVVARILLPPL